MPHVDDLRNLRTDLKKAQKRLEDGELFRDVLQRALDQLMLDDGDVAHQLGVSRTTVNRWKNGNAIPYALMRKPVYTFLLRRVTAGIEKLGEDADDTMSIRVADVDRVAAR